MSRFWDAPDDGICDACGKPITKQQFMIEGVISTLTVKKPIQLHVGCFQFGDTERSAPKSQPSRAYSLSGSDEEPGFR
jgi:hypothetical protein